MNQFSLNARVGVDDAVDDWVDDAPIGVVDGVVDGVDDGVDDSPIGVDDQVDDAQIPIMPVLWQPPSDIRPEYSSELSGLCGGEIKLRTHSLICKTCFCLLDWKVLPLRWGAFYANWKSLKYEITSRSNKLTSIQWSHNMNVI